MAGGDSSGSSSPTLAERMRSNELLTQALGQFIANQMQNQPQPENPRAVLADKIARLKPTTFTGVENPTVLRNWIREFEKTFNTTGTPDDQKVDQAVYYLREKADVWWSANSAALLARPGFGWEAFKEALRDKYNPPHMQQKMYEEFVHLEQGTLSVTEYYEKFDELSQFAPALVPDEAKKVSKFIRGLNPGLQFYVLGGNHTSLANAYNHACQLSEAKEQLKAKSANQKRLNESGNSANGNNGSGKRHNSGNGGGNNQFRSGNSGNQSTQSGNRNGNGGNRNQTYFNHGGHLKSGNRSNQPQFAPCPKCNKNHPGYTCNGDRVVCYRCGVAGHRANNCRNPSVGGSSQAPPNAPRLEYGNNSSGSDSGNNRNNGSGRGGGRGGFSGSQRPPYVGNNSGTSQSAIPSGPKPISSAPPASGATPTARLHVMSTSEAERSGKVLTGTFSVNSIPAFVLFDSGASDSFVSKEFAAKLNSIPSVSCSEYVSVPSGGVVACSKLFEKVPIRIKNTDFHANLIEFNSLLGFDVVLGWDWLQKYDANIECGLEKITLKGKRGKRVTYQRLNNKPKIRFISCLQMQKHVRHGHDVFICQIKNVSF